MCMVSAQLQPGFPPCPGFPQGPGFPPHMPIHSLCNNVRCGFGHVCRVVQECHFCAPHPACVPCVPRAVDAVCHRHHFLEAVLTGDRLFHTQLVPRRCSPFVPGNCPFDSHCVSDGLGHGVCCYNKSPFGLPWPVTSHHPQCQDIFGGGFGLAVGVGAALGLGNE